jgi:hypothetical protein
MSRKDFEALASNLRSQRPAAWNYRNTDANAAEVWACETWRRCVLAVSDACRLSNPRFNGTLFQAACGYEPTNEPAFKVV